MQVSRIFASNKYQYLKHMLEIENAAHIDPWSENELSSSFDDRYFVYGIFAEEENPENILGYAIYDYVLDTATLQNICITPRNQGNGLGFNLLSKSLELLAQSESFQPKLEKIFLEVRISNIKAINLYKKVGFVEDGIRKNYYPCASGREHALLMSKSIDE